MAAGGSSWYVTGKPSKLPSASRDGASGGATVTACARSDADALQQQGPGRNDAASPSSPWSGCPSDTWLWQQQGDSDAAKAQPMNVATLPCNANSAQKTVVKMERGTTWLNIRQA